MLIPRTATALSAAVRAGQVTPEQAVAASLDRIAAHDGRIAAFAGVRAEAALVEARAVGARDDLAKLPLAGVPVAVKDLVAVAGEPLRAGSLATPDDPRPADAPLVARLREAGAIVVGRAATCEGALWPMSDGPHGVTRNPWQPDRTAGGSSGGSAAAVAAGFVPVAHASDGLGSIRIPASACGLVGVKPSTGVIGESDGSARAWYGMAEDGVVATTVDDAALVTSVLAGRPDLAVPGDLPAGLRVGVTVTAPITGCPVDRHVVRATYAAAVALQEAGAIVARRKVTYPLSLQWAITVRWFAVACPPVDDAAHPERLQRRTRGHARIGRLARPFVREADARAWRARALRLFETDDVLLTPVLAQGPAAAREWSRAPWLANLAAALSSSGGFTPPWNVADLPTVAVPAGRHPVTGAPIGVQLVGPPGSEGRLLAVAAAYERVRPWPLWAPGFVSDLAPAERPGL